VEFEGKMGILIAEREAVESWRSLTETALQQEFGRSDETLAIFRGKLSTCPEFVHPDVNERSLLFECVDFSYELQASFSRIGVATEVQGSNVNPDGARHAYVTPISNERDIIIDPTMGQILHGHNHVFVGTRPQLRNFVYAQMRSDAQYRIDSFYGSDRERMFEELWGYGSTPGSEYSYPLKPIIEKQKTDIDDSFLKALLKATPLLRNE
jgi:hypothetical protein